MPVINEQFIGVKEPNNVTVKKALLYRETILSWVYRAVLPNATFQLLTNKLMLVMTRECKCLVFWISLRQKLRQKY